MQPPSLLFLSGVGNKSEAKALIPSAWGFSASQPYTWWLPCSGDPLAWRGNVVLTQILAYGLPFLHHGKKVPLIRGFFPAA